MAKRVEKTLVEFKEYCETHVFDDVDDFAESVYFEVYDSKEFRALAHSFRAAQTALFKFCSKENVNCKFMGDD